MSIVSISEAARLTGKDRRTIQRHLATGKLSKAAGGEGLDTTELLRVYGAFVAAHGVATKNEAMPQETAAYAAHIADHEKEALKAENEKLKAILEAKQETIDSLKQALLVIEHKVVPMQDERPEKTIKKSIFGWFKS